MANQNAKATAVIAHEIRIAVTTSLNHSRRTRTPLWCQFADRKLNRASKLNRAKCQTAQEGASGPDVRFGSRLCETPVDAMILLLNRRGK